MPESPGRRVYKLFTWTPDNEFFVLLQGPEVEDFRRLCLRLLPQAGRLALERNPDHVVWGEEVLQALAEVLESEGFRPLEAVTFELDVKGHFMHEDDSECARAMGGVFAEIVNHNWGGLEEV